MSLFLEFWAPLSSVLLATAAFCIARSRQQQKLREDVLTAFATRNDAVGLQLCDYLPEEEGRVWRRLITARAGLEESERENSRARRDLEDVLASLEDAVLVVDGEGRLRFLNAAALEIFQVRIESVLGANLIEAVPSFNLDSVVRDVLRDRKSHSKEVHLYSPQLREVLLRVSPLFSGSGYVAGAVAILSDLTEVRRLERVRREFVANASHELRTPVANILASTETIMHDPEDAELVRRFLPPMAKEADRLSRLVSDMLDLARAEAGEQAALRPIDLGAVVQSAVDRLVEKAARRNIDLKWDSLSEPYLVSGDSAGLEQVIFNLVDNALSYTPLEGRVALQLYRAVVAGEGDLDDVDPNSVVFEVTDSGIGIPAEDLEQIFERFYRVDKARSRAEGGTGLGLAIVKHIVENHGGHVEAESVVGQGTTFRVTLPAV